MKEAVTKVIDMLTQEDFHGGLKNLLERYNKCIAAGGDYFEGDFSFTRVLSIKVSIRKESETLFNDPRILQKSNLSFIAHFYLVNTASVSIIYFHTVRILTRINFWFIVHFYLGQYSFSVDTF